MDSVEAEDAAAAVVVVVDDYEKEYDMLKKAKNETAVSCVDGSFVWRLLMLWCCGVAEIQADDQPSGHEEHRQLLYQEMIVVESI